MKRIYKFDISSSTQEIEINEDYQLLCIGYQGSRLRAWCIVDPSKKIAKVKFYILPTGAEVPDGKVYIDTLFDGPFVWHVFIDDTKTVIGGPIRPPIRARRE